MKKTTLAMAASVLAMTATAVFAQAASSGPGSTAMTRAQATAMANEMWTRMDVNNDGVINQADREARRTQKFDQMDTNKDGSLSRDEFNAAHPAQGPGEAGMNHGEHGMMGDKMAGHMDHRKDGAMAGKMDGRMGGMGGMGMMMLHMADANKDGSVTRAEFDAAVKQHLDQMDTNKDGTISPAEHRAAHAEMKKHMQSMRMQAPQGSAQ